MITVVLAGDGRAIEGGKAGKVKLFRTGDDATTALTVRYKVKGAVAGRDYEALLGEVTIPAGATQAKLKIKAVNDSAQEGPRLAKIKLVPAPDGSYLIGDLKTAKVKIIDND